MKPVVFNDPPIFFGRTERNDAGDTGLHLCGHHPEWASVQCVRTVSTRQQSGPRLFGVSVLYMPVAQELSVWIPGYAR